MKKLSLIASAAILALAASAASPMPHYPASQMLGTSSHEAMTMAHIKLPSVKKAPATRSLEEPVSSFVANEANFYYYGDLLRNGTGVYMLCLSTAGIKKGNPVHEGQMARIIFIGDPCDEDAPVLPTGDYTVDYTFAAGTVSPDDTDFMDVFYLPDEPNTLVGYIWYPYEGELKIAADEAGYNINFSMLGEIYSDDDEILDSRPCSASYTGPVPYVDLHAYTPIPNDVEINLPNASGRYSDGDFSITFYSDGLLDEAGFIDGAGQTLNVEIFTEDVAPMNLDLMCGTLLPVDVWTEGPLPGTFMQGTWYDIFGGYYVALGTAYVEYDDMGISQDVGLATDGTITVSKGENGTYTFLFDLITKEGKKMTGSWTGPIADYIADFSTPNALESVGAAAGEAQYTTLQGIAVANPGPGLYIRRCGDNVCKVIVK